MGKKLGQHFLKDPRILDRIVDALEPCPDDIVLEVGTGAAHLTRQVCPRVAEVHTIEVDNQLFQSLTTLHLKQNIKLYHGDALELDWHRMLDRRPFKVIGNVPYYITSPLIEKALVPPLPGCVVFLVQAEVADRLVADPGSKTFGALSVGVQAVAGVEKLFTVKPGSFSVPPRVDSAVVRIRPRADPLIIDSERPAFRKFVTGVFSLRRKQLQKILKTEGGVEAGEIEPLLRRLGIDPQARPETLAPERLAELFRETRRVD